MKSRLPRPRGHADAPELELAFELDPRLPERVAVGKGTLLFVRGFFSGSRARSVKRLYLSDDGQRHEVVEPGLQARGERIASGAASAGACCRSSLSSGRARRLLGVVAELKDGSIEELALAEVELRPRLGAEFDGELRRRPAPGTSDGPKRASSPAEAADCDRDRDPGARRRAVRSARSIRSGRRATRAWLCLISDDASSAESIAEIRRLIGDDPRFLLWPSSRRRGRTANFERALAMVPGNADLVAPAEQSGYWYPHKLEVLRSRIDGERQARLRRPARDLGRRRCCRGTLVRPQAVRDGRPLLASGLELRSRQQLADPP